MKDRLLTRRICKLCWIFFGTLGWTTSVAAQHTGDSSYRFLDGSLSEERLNAPLAFQANYIGETFSNAKGGKSTNDATQYQGLVNLNLKFDLAGAGTALPGHLFMLVQNTHGRGLTEDFVGDTQVISNIDSFDNIMQVSEYGWESRWLDDDVVILLGKQDINNHFQLIEAAEFFVQSTFGLSPSTAFPTYPNQALGAVALLRLNETLTWKLGAWSAFAKGSTFGFSNSEAYLTVTELERTYALLDDQLPGIISVGALYESDGILDGVSVAAVQEYYVQWEQCMYRESSSLAGDSEGLTAFAGFYPRFSSEEPLEKSIGHSAVGGLTYRGLLPHRRQDVLGLGLAWSQLFQGGSNQETATELFYRVVCSPKLSFQPDLQYVSTPSGIFKDSLVAGFRFELTP